MQLLLDIPKAGRKKKITQITHSSVFYGMRGDWSIFWNAADQAYCSAYTDRQTDTYANTQACTCHPVIVMKQDNTLPHLIHLDDVG